jgi:hypothetical protein
MSFALCERACRKQKHVNIIQFSLSMEKDAFQYPNANGTTTCALP